MKHALIVIAAFLTTAQLAEAQVEVAILAAGTGNDQVQIQLNASPEGGTVAMPVGTLVSTGDLSQQDLVLGEAVEMNLEPNERRTISVAAYCVHSSRSVPNTGVSMAQAGVGERELQRLMAVQNQFSHDIMQRAVWAYRNRETTTDSQVEKVFLVAGVVVK
ncbi:MAG: hypothetical protein AAGE52_17430 [Myxococcota bacterium]